MRTFIVTAFVAWAVWIGRPAVAEEAAVDLGCAASCQATTVLGGLHHCARCGCKEKCRRYVCHIVCDTKKVTKTCWDVQCEPFCPLLPGCGAFLPQRCCPGGPCASNGGTPDCGGQQCGSCTSCQRSEVPPRCGNARTRKRLVKKEITVEVPVYRCEVKYLCDACSVEESAEAAPSQHAERAEPAPLPPVSRVQAPALYPMLGDDA